jgi:hypothetical protein
LLLAAFPELLGVREGALAHLLAVVADLGVPELPLERSPVRWAITASAARCPTVAAVVLSAAV